MLCCPQQIDLIVYQIACCKRLGILNHLSTIYIGYTALLPGGCVCLTTPVHKLWRGWGGLENAAKRNVKTDRLRFCPMTPKRFLETNVRINSKAPPLIMHIVVASTVQFFICPSLIVPINSSE